MNQKEHYSKIAEDLLCNEKTIRRSEFSRNMQIIPSKALS